VKLFIHSGRYTELARRQLASIGIHATEKGGILSGICGGDQGDKKQQVRYHLQNGGIDDPREFLVVGDTQDDLDAATQNGAHSVMITHR
jgi:phosphoglycolate phosphatase-like HAD superfamily hydrolase